MKNAVIIYITIILIPMILFAQTSKSATGTVDIQASFNKAIEKISSPYNINKSKGQASYLKALTSLQTQAQKAGDLDSLMFIKEEITRFRASKALHSDNIVTDSESVAQLQKKALTIFNRLEVDRCKEIISLGDKYKARIEEMIKKNTINGKIDEAIALKKELEAIDTHEDVSSAKFALAALDISIDDTEETSGSSPKTAVPENSKIINIPGEAIVHPAGQRPKNNSSERYSALRLRKTSNVPMSLQLVSASAFVTSSSNSKKTTSSSYYSRTSKSSSTQTKLRVQVKTTKSDTVLEGVSVFAQLYAKETTGGSSKIAPRLLATRNADLTAIDKRGYYIDFPGVSTSKSSSRRSSRYSSSRPSKSGQEFYGVIISAYDADNKLIYQGATANSLSDLATTEKPETTGSKPVKFNGNWYKLVGKSLPWLPANMMCEDMDGHIVTIESEEENDFIAELADGDSYWIGLTDENEEGNRVWLNGAEPKFKAWAEDEPDDTAPSEDYSYGSDGEWYGGYASSSHQIICEWEAE